MQITGTCILFMSSVALTQTVTALSVFIAGRVTDCFPEPRVSDSTSIMQAVAISARSYLRPCTVSHCFHSSVDCFCFAL